MARMPEGKESAENLAAFPTAQRFSSTTIQRMQSRARAY